MCDVIAHNNYIGEGQLLFQLMHIFKLGILLDKNLGDQCS